MARLCASGVSAFADLMGGFGVFFIERRSKRIILAVDRFSIETACFGMEGNRFSFSDRADAVPLDSRTLSAQCIHDYLYFHTVPAPATIFREVRRLEHGGHLCIEHGELRLGSHWQPRFEEIRGVTLAARSEQFR